MTSTKRTGSPRARKRAAGNPADAVLAYCAGCGSYAPVEAVNVGRVFGEGPGHVCDGCRTRDDGDGGDQEPIVPHTGQSTSVVTMTEDE